MCVVEDGMVVVVQRDGTTKRRCDECCPASSTVVILGWLWCVMEMVLTVKREVSVIA